ncbi:response regulator [Ethanoligenens harbinense]|uniref:Stage 0 sporulation protein A homolog n=1 Tax=Ethanoligenens harbinense (strain DSM 18485 / JCM 12961 / CGMCC 1.5033 / YUAN-3) TaxID=663278 RepID=E6U4Q7_ETHHY|nr:response regulator transcription factor [Ethanoligenens harbinense]ADU26685.1 two component transcriptional regulator, LuxR family [Ethanoligenens harbinense YUAN-3]AVQ95802.1 DNA-binding response regulator [Ethanoligenens harbinense YUAN-3]AYF41209.1 DNA-binding response regulator [Ethanoligenens harbinense]QCN92042.1 DNA-binding response regulator [Ethanoligenens harbinense]
MIQVLIADDQTLMRDGLKTILELEPDIAVTGLAADGEEACAICDTRKPDVVLMDIRMPVMDGVAATAAIKKRHPSIAVLVLTTFDDDESIVQALKNGAIGYLLKDIEADRLIQTVRDAAQGQFTWPAMLAAKLTKHLCANVPALSGRLAALTGRERDVANLLAGGYTNRRIAQMLYLSEGTVKNHVSSIYSKLGIYDRTAAALALRRALDK